MYTDEEEDVARWASWLADHGEPDGSKRTELDAWLADRPQRAGALLRAQAMLAQVASVRVLATAATAEAPPLPPRISRRHLAGGGLLAAGFAGLLVLMPHGERFATAIGETRRVPLADGSVATLNTRSALKVTIGERSRLAELDDGEAWFQVAHDRTRPFVVEAGRVRVRAVGTAFSVRRRGSAVDVLVTDGAVEAWTEGAGWKPVKVSAGAHVRLDEAALRSPRPIMATHDVERTLAWRNGELALDDDTLAMAAGELNRYNRIQLRIHPSLADLRLTGYFQTQDAAGFARTVAAMVKGRLVERQDTIIIAPSAEPADGL